MNNFVGRRKLNTYVAPFFAKQNKKKMKKKIPTAVFQSVIDVRKNRPNCSSLTNIFRPLFRWLRLSMKRTKNALLLV